MASSAATEVSSHPRQPEPTDLRRIGIDPDFWYPVARSRNLKRGKTLAVHFAGDPIVLVRPKDGSCFALEDRCAHRQVSVPRASGVAITAGPMTRPGTASISLT